jgi:hypothetical protein
MIDLGVPQVGKDEDLSALCRDATMLGGGRHAANAGEAVKLKVERDEVVEEDKEQEEEKKAKDPMFGQWIRMQATVTNNSVEESFSDQVEMEYRLEKARMKKIRKENEKKKRRFWTETERTFKPTRGYNNQPSASGSSTPSSNRDNQKKPKSLGATKAAPSSAGNLATVWQ